MYTRFIFCCLFETFYFTSTCVTNSSDFSTLIGTKQFVDKTTFLKYILRESNMYLTAPSGFGKSSLMTMARTFFAGKFDSSGNKVTATDDIKKMFSHPERFSGDKTSLNIYQDKKFFNTYFQSCPVLFIDLQPLSLTRDYSTYKANMCTVYWNTLNMFDSDVPSSNRCECLANELTELHQKAVIFIKNCVTKFDSRSGWLQRFSSSMHECYKRKVLVLIDEFDSLLQAILTSNIPSAEAETMMRNMIGVFTELSKDNYAVFSTVAMGVLNLGAMRAGQLNNIDHRDFFFDETLGQYFGFQKDDVSLLLRRYGLEGKEEIAARFYGGYRVYGREDEIYNSRSILTFCDTRGKAGIKMAAWHKVLNPIFSDVEFGKKIFDSLKGDVTTRINIVHNVLGYETIVEILKTIHSNGIDKQGWGLAPAEPDIIFQYFLQNGYYRLTKKRNANKGFLQYTITIEPTNEETRRALFTALLKSKHFELKYNVKPHQFQRFYEALANTANNVAQYEELVKSVYEMIKGLPQNKIDLPVFLYAAIKKLDIDGRLRAHEIELTLKNHHVVDFSMLGKLPVAFVVKIEKTRTAYDGIRQMIEDDHVTALKQASFVKYTIENVVLLGLKCSPVGKSKEGEEMENQCSLCHLFSQIKEFDERDLKEVKCVAYPDKDGKTVKGLYKLRDNDKWVKNKKSKKEEATR